MPRECSICGCSYRDMFAFKGGYVCENCLQFLQTEFQADSFVRSKSDD